MWWEDTSLAQSKTSTVAFSYLSFQHPSPISSCSSKSLLIFTKKLQHSHALFLLSWNSVYLPWVICLPFNINFTSLQYFPSALPGKLFHTFQNTNTHTHTHTQYTLHSDLLSKAQTWRKGRGLDGKHQNVLSKWKETGCEYLCFDIYYCHTFYFLCATRQNFH